MPGVKLHAPSGDRCTARLGRRPARRSRADRRSPVLLRPIAVHRHQHVGVRGQAVGVVDDDAAMLAQGVGHLPGSCSGRMPARRRSGPASRGDFPGGGHSASISTDEVSSPFLVARRRFMYCAAATTASCARPSSAGRRNGFGLAPGCCTPLTNRPPKNRPFSTSQRSCAPPCRTQAMER